MKRVTSHNYPVGLATLLLCSLLLCGCNATTGLFGSKKTKPQPAEELNRTTVTAEWYDQPAEKAPEPETPVAEPEPEVKPTVELPVASTPATVTFQKLETEHVKFSYYDPFNGTGNRFVVDLDAQEFCYPYPGKLISGYGTRNRRTHTGVDIKAVPRDTIRAAFGGIVRMARPYADYGNCIVIRHSNGLETLYSHNAKNLVKVGDVVAVGEPVALAGRTGRATTEHLHFEVRILGQHINPNLLLNTENQSIQKGVLAVTKNGSRVTARRKATLEDALNVPVTYIAATEPIAPAQAPVATKPASTTTTTAASATSTIHKVVSGDTLWALAKKYKTSVAKICSLNGISEKSTLRLGQKLKIR